MMTMRHNTAKLFAAAAALTLVVAGCTVQEENARQREIKFTASVGSFQVKATDTAFEAGDTIGLFANHPVSASNVCLAWQNGGLTPETPVYWGADQLVDQSTLFYAYYPYNARLEGDRNISFSVKEDQSTPAAYTASDLMTASTYATPAEGTVQLNFVHRLSKLVLTIDNQLADDAVKEVYVGNVKLSTNVDLAISQEYYAAGEPGAIKACEGGIVTQDGVAQQAWSVIFPSQSTLPRIMIVTRSGKEYVYETDYDIYFGASRRHYAHLILDQTALSASFTSTVFDWYEGEDFWFKQDNIARYLGDWAVIGSFQGTAWDKDFWMERSGDYGWTATIEYRTGESFKFRMNGTWDVNLGASWNAVLGSWEWISLVDDGADIQLSEDGIWCLNIDVRYKEFYAYKIADLPQPQDPNAIIQIDGNMSDWANIPGIEDNTGAYASFKAVADDNYLYLYSRRTSENFAGIWGENGYFYYFFDTDRNPETGDGVLWSNGPSEAILLVYPFGGSADYPEFVISGKNTVAPDYLTAGNVILKGAISDNGVEIELRIPVSDLGLPRNRVIDVTTWGNKGATNMRGQSLALTIGEVVEPVLDQIQPIVDVADDTWVDFTQVVYALSSRGFVLFDGKYSILVYTGSEPGVRIGDIVHVCGTRIHYNNVPEVNQPSWEVVGHTDDLMDLTYMYNDVTGYLDQDFANIAIPISMEGVVSSDGFTIEVADQAFNGSIFYPASEFSLASLYGHKVRVSGFYNGRRDDSKLVYIIATAVEDLGEVQSGYTAQGDGSLDNPFNATAAFQYAAGLASGEVAGPFYVRGIISNVKYTFSETYNTATFWISDDGSAEAPQFQAYNVYYFNASAWVEGDMQVEVGADVIIYGSITNYKGAPETASKQATIYSLNGWTGPGEAVDFSGWSIVGDIYGTAWDQDFPLTASSNPAVQYITITYNEGEQFKFRRNGDWTQNYGLGDSGTVYTASSGVSHSLIESGGNIQFGSSGVWKITVDLENLLFVAEKQQDAGQGIMVHLSKEELAGLSTDGESVPLADGILTLTNSSSYTATVTELRVYKGKTLTLSVPEGYAITSVTMTCGASDTTKYGPGCFGSGAPDGYSFEGNQGVWTGYANEVNFTAIDNQVRITELTIVIAVQ